MNLCVGRLSTRSNGLVPGFHCPYWLYKEGKVCSYVFHPQGFFVKTTKNGCPILVITTALFVLLGMVRISEVVRHPQYRVGVLKKLRRKFRTIVGDSMNVCKILVHPVVL